LPQNDAGFGERLKVAVQQAGGLKLVARELGRGESTFYTYFNGKSSPSVAEVVRICELAGVRPAWLVSNEGPMLASDSRPAEAEPERPDIVDVPVLASLASAGTGAVLSDAAEERGTMPMPTRWLRRFGTPSRLRLVEIVGNSMSPDLEAGDWMLVNLDRVELREGVALVRYDDTLLVKRLQPQGRQLLLTSSNKAYTPIPVDLQKDVDRFAIIGFGEGLLRARGPA
jgi:phage repressor protein C with HTH and peptisase S24 domain